MMKLYNTLSRKIEEFTPIDPPKVGLYTCGPTVYFYPQIGNWRTFIFGDLLKRTLQFFGYEVTHVMNVTDVGHLTGDNLGDADLGEDRMEKAAKKEGKTAWDIADFYINDFIGSREKLNILLPNYFTRATDNIQEQIDLVKKLEEKGMTYTTKMGVYFDVSKFPDYGKLGGQKMIDKRVATRDELVEDVEKRNPFDFALWKFSPTSASGQDKRQMEWESPWGVGFPGWHLECSAMSMKYLGEQFDIHTGGVDHIAIHHTNEIAQSEGATGKLPAKFWMHGEFLRVDGGRMGKSLGNAYTLHDIEEKGFEPVALRYLYLTAHYRDTLNFTWESLKAAQISLNNLRELVLAAKSDKGRPSLSTEKMKKVDDFMAEFKDAIGNDLNVPQALAVLWKVLKSNIPSVDKYDLAISFDEVLGLRLSEAATKLENTPQEILELAKKREEYRAAKDFVNADKMREEIESKGYMLEDTSDGLKIRVKILN